MKHSFEVPAQSPGEALERLREILLYLMSEDGCPWDRAQTHESLKKCLIEEAYEVTDAIDRKDMPHLEEELGDVLLQVVFHSNLGEKSNNFDFISITNHVCEKMLRRHPHVFSDSKAESVDKAVEKWENVKRKEKDRPSHTHSMRGIPKELPALIKSHKIQEKAAHVGFDWDDPMDALRKVEEELEEVREHYPNGDRVRLKEEIGDLLFAVVNVARFMEIDPEEALHFTSKKFVDRFEFIEETATSWGNRLEDMSLQEMDKLWEQAKKSRRID